MQLEDEVMRKGKIGREGYIRTEETDEQKGKSRRKGFRPG
jgi:hypothetical protein